MKKLFGLLAGIGIVLGLASLGNDAINILLAIAVWIYIVKG